jgi:hypothetical protein
MWWVPLLLLLRARAVLHDPHVTPGKLQLWAGATRQSMFMMVMKLSLMHTCARMQ